MLSFALSQQTRKGSFDFLAIPSLNKAMVLELAR